MLLNWIPFQRKEAMSQGLPLEENKRHSKSIAEAGRSADRLMTLNMMPEPPTESKRIKRRRNCARCI